LEFVQPSPYDSPYPSEPPTANQPPSRPLARMGIVVPAAVITALVAIAAAANQAVAKQMDKTHGEVHTYLSAWLSFRWRFAPHPWPTRLWAAQLALIGTVLVLTGLLVWALLRGSVSWVRAFFGTWAAVVFATAIGAFVRGLVVPDDLGRVPGASRVTGALFGPYGPNAGAVFAGFVLGLVVALVTSVLAIATRRSPYRDDREQEAVPPGPPAFADYAPPPPRTPGDPPPWQDQQFGPRAGEQPTTRLAPPPASPQQPAPPQQFHEPANEPPAPSQPAPPNQPEPVDQPGRSSRPESADRPEAANQPQPANQPASRPENQPTTQLPPAGAGDQATTRFPRPPDDEDLGHIEH
jgi:hypothetical protein